MIYEMANKNLITELIERKNMKIVELHADDYAISPHSSEDILACLRAGKLDGISVLTNMSCYEEYAKKYQQECAAWPKRPLLSVHLNFMEGHCVAPTEQVPHLVDERGYFKIGWGTLFLWNYSPKKFLQIKKELKAEIQAQTERFRSYFGKDIALRFDGHQHTQMIPIVYWALLEVIVEQHYPTEYIRITKEPILPYLKNMGLWGTYRPINWIKNLILNIFAPGMERTIEKNHPSWQQEMQPMLLWGVLMSGHMDEKRVKRLWPAMEAYAQRKKRHLEILFHPGTVLEEELKEEFSNKDANLFHISEGRRQEYEALMALSEEKE